MSRAQPTSVRTVLVLLVAASFLGQLRLRRTGGIRAHVELLQKVTPIQQFAPVAGHRAFADLTDRFDITIVAHRARRNEPYLLVPIDERAVAAWLA